MDVAKNYLFWKLWKRAFQNLNVGFNRGNDREWLSYVKMVKDRMRVPPKIRD